MEDWIEYDYNPWILFDQNGKVKSLNTEAQYLLAEVSYQEIFNLAVNHANVTYGFRSTMIDLTFGRFEIFCIMIGYENDEEIAIRLYQKPPQRIEEAHMERLQNCNIYALIDLVVAANSINRDGKIQLDVDPALPEIKLNPDVFIKLMNKMIEMFEPTDLTITMLLKPGESIKFETRRYPIVKITIKGKRSRTVNAGTYKELAGKINSYFVANKEKLSLEMPLIAS